ncbi:MAG: VTT domain-containing protein [Lachnospiraceae bacterium]|nr:VTT domain-containing protein [Lachnospiraceae bacterium]
MHQWNKKNLLRMIPLLLCLAFVVGYLIWGKDFSVETILSYAPKNPWLTAAFLLLMYAVKGMSVVFPIIILYMAGGFLFPPMIAVLVNALGVAVTLMVPYWISRVSRTDSAERLAAKYPKLEEIIAHQKGNTFFLSFFLRIISCLPGDAVSMYLGAIKIPFLKYFLGSMLGTVPRMIAETLMGTSITDPASPMFLISTGVTVLLAVLSVCGYAIYKRRMKKKREG